MHIHTKTSSSLEPEIYFLVRDAFYHGPDRNGDLSDPALNSPLSTAGIATAFPGFVSTREAADSLPALADYYQQVVAAAQRHHKRFDQIRHYFWMRLWLADREQSASISFPWYDTLAEMRRFAQALIVEDDGLLFSDMEQGWSLEAHAAGDQLTLTETDPDEDATEGLSLQVPRHALCTHMAEAITRAEQVIAALSYEVGTDVWSEYIRSEPAFRTC